VVQYEKVFKKEYGEADQVKKGGFNFWYGNVNGEKALFAYQDGVEMVEVDRVD